MPRVDHSAMHHGRTGWVPSAHSITHLAPVQSPPRSHRPTRRMKLNRLAQGADTKIQSFNYRLPIVDSIRYRLALALGA